MILCHGDISAKQLWKPNFYQRKNNDQVLFSQNDAGSSRGRVVAHFGMMFTQVLNIATGHCINIYSTGKLFFKFCRHQSELGDSSAAAAFESDHICPPRQNLLIVTKFSKTRMSGKVLQYVIHPHEAHLCTKRSTSREEVCGPTQLLWMPAILTLCDSLGRDRSRGLSRVWREVVLCRHSELQHIVCCFLSFVLCALFMYVYQDGGRDIKALFGCGRILNDKKTNPKSLPLSSFGRTAILIEQVYSCTQEHRQTWPQTSSQQTQWVCSPKSYSAHPAWPCLNFPHVRTSLNLHLNLTSDLPLASLKGVRWVFLLWYLALNLRWRFGW